MAYQILIKSYCGGKILLQAFYIYISIVLTCRYLKTGGYFVELFRDLLC